MGKLRFADRMKEAAEIPDTGFDALAVAPLNEVEDNRPVALRGGAERPSMAMLACLLRITGRALARQGMVRAEGDCSARLDDGRFLMSPDIPPGLMTPATRLLVVPLSGPVPDNAPPHAALHQRLYQTRPDIGAIIHAFPECLTGLTMIMAQDGGETGAGQADNALVARLGSGAMLPMGRRGVITVGHSIEAALAWLWRWEEAARLAGPGMAVDLAGMECPTEREIGRIWQFCVAGDAEITQVDSPANWLTCGGALAPLRHDGVEEKDAAALMQMEPQDFDYWHSPGHLLRRCTQRAHDIFHDVLGENISVTRQQFVVLWAIRDNPAASQQHLSEITGWDRNTMAGMLTRLQKQGLIERRKDERDARQSRIFLTDTSRVMLRDLVPGLLEVRRRVLEPLPPHLREVFVQCARIMLGLPSDPA